MECCGETPSVTGRIASGVKGLAKAVVGVDRAPASFVEIRLGHCFGVPPNKPPCQHQKPNGLLKIAKLGKYAECCELCSCVIVLKAKDASECCPLGKWGKVKPHTKKDK